MSRLGIGHLRRRHIRELSGGQQQRVFLARALVSNPQLLLLDEPTAGVDIKTRDDMLHLLDELNHDGVTIVLTTHELNAVAAHLPWVVCINGGIVAEGAARDACSRRRSWAARTSAEMNVIVHDGMTHGRGDAAPLRPQRQARRGVRGPARDREAPPCLIWTEPFQYEFFVRGLFAATLAGALCGMLGVYIVLRRMSYIGHGLSHAVFGGAVVSYVIGINFYIGAGLWGFLSAVLINLTSRKRTIGADAAIGIITTASFALGVLLISRYRTFTRSFDAALFGSILGVTDRDLHHPARRRRS